MRLTLYLMLAVLAFGLVAFVVTNPEARVSIVFWNQHYPDLPVFVVVFAALSVGVVLTAIVALVEGATIRLQNHRLRREVRRLETENNLLRTQPSRPAPPEPESVPVKTTRTSRDDEPAPNLPSAPVYVAEDDPENA